MLVKLRPERVVGDLSVPDDGAGVREGSFLPFRELVRLGEIQQLVVLRFGESLPSGPDGALDPSVLALNRFRYVDAAEFFKTVVQDAVAEGQLPGLRKRPDDTRVVRPDRLALGSRRPLDAGTLQVAKNFWICDGGRIRIRDFWHRSTPHAGWIWSAVQRYVLMKGLSSGIGESPFDTDILLRFPYLGKKFLGRGIQKGTMLANTTIA